MVVVVVVRVAEVADVVLIVIAVVVVEVFRMRVGVVIFVVAAMGVIVVEV